MKIPPDIFEKVQQNSVLQAVADGQIQFDGELVSPGETEAALTQFSLEFIRANKVVLIIDPVATNWVPLLFGLVYHQHVIGGSESLGLGSNSSLLLCTSPGYINQFDKFAFQRSLNQQSLLTTRNIASDGFDPTDCFHYALAPDHLQTLPAEAAFGAVYVDFRWPAWREQLYRLKGFAGRHSVNSYLFLVDSFEGAREVMRQLKRQNIEVTRAWLTSGPDPTIDETATETRRLEHILHRSISVNLTVTADESLVDHFRTLYSLHKQIQDETQRYVPSGRLFRELSALSVPPSTFDRVVGTQYGKMAIADILDQLRQQATQLSSGTAPLVTSFADKADALRALLEDGNLKQSVLVDRVQSTTEATPTRFVFRDDAQCAAFETYMEEIGESLPTGSEALSADAVSAGNRRIVFVGLMRRSSSVYAFPQANDIEVLAYPTETGPIRGQLESPKQLVSEDEQAVEVNIETTTIGGTPERLEFSVEDLKESISERVLARFNDEPTDDQSDTKSTDRRDRNTDNYRLYLEDGTTVETVGSRRFTVYDADEEQVRQKATTALTVGESIVRLTETQEDLYEYIREQEPDDGMLAKHDALVEYWRELIQDAIAEESAAAVRDALNDAGSSIDAGLTIKFWASGHTIGPQDPADTRRVLELYEPPLAHEAEKFHGAIVWLRSFRGEVGRELRRLLEQELDPRQSLDVGVGLRQRVIKVRDEIEIIQIENVEQSI